jgi:hypothetical protein
MLRWLLAAAHLLALGIGLGAVWARSRALRGSLDPAGLRRVLGADAWWSAGADSPPTANGWIPGPRCAWPASVCCRRSS